MAVDGNSPTPSSQFKGTNNSQTHKSQSLPQLCNHFNKGTCKFGDHCKFIHDHGNRADLQVKSSTGSNNSCMGGNTRMINIMGANIFNRMATSQLRQTNHAPPGIYASRMTHQHFNHPKITYASRMPPSAKPTSGPKYVCGPTVPGPKTPITIHTSLMHLPISTEAY